MIMRLKEVYLFEWGEVHVTWRIPEIDGERRPFDAKKWEPFVEIFKKEELPDDLQPY